MPTPSPCLGQSRATSSVHFVEHQLQLSSCSVTDCYKPAASDGLAEDSRKAAPQAKAGRRQAERGSVSSGESCNTATLSHGWE